jgi:hypothetical protein
MTTKQAALVSSADVASAKGALLTISLGHRPREWLCLEKTSAESAIHYFVTARLKHAFSADFAGDLNPWGAAPGLGEVRLWRQKENGFDFNPLFATPFPVRARWGVSNKSRCKAGVASGCSSFFRSICAVLE